MKNKFKPKGIKTGMAQQRPPMDEWMKEYNSPQGRWVAGLISVLKSFTK